MGSCADEVLALARGAASLLPCPAAALSNLCRRVDIPGAISLIQQAVQEAVTAIRQEQQQRPVALASHEAGAASSEHLLLQGVLEVASICPSNGSLATLNQGYSVGAWTAALAAAGFGVSTVHVKTWKRALGLLGPDHGKDASRELALAVARATEAAPQDELLRCVRRDVA